MPTIELISVGCEVVPDLPEYPSFAHIIEEGVRSHRGFFQSSFDLLKGVIVHLANKLPEDLDRGFWFGGELVDWDRPGRTLVFHPEVRRGLEDLMRRLLDASPAGWITFSTDYQFGGKKREGHKVAMTQFLAQHDCDKLCLNELWFIHRDRGEV